MTESFLQGFQIQNASHYLLQDFSISWCPDLNFSLARPFKKSQGLHDRYQTFFFLSANILFNNFEKLYNLHMHL